jgi:hypothetical protein
MPIDFISTRFLPWLPIVWVILAWIRASSKVLNSLRNNPMKGLKSLV